MINEVVCFCSDVERVHVSLCVCVCDDVKVNLGTGGGKKKANKAEFHFLRGEGVRDGEEKRKIKKEGRY